MQSFQHGPDYSFVRVMAEQQHERADEIIRQRCEQLSHDMQTTLANAKGWLVQDFDEGASRNSQLNPPVRYRQTA